MRTMKCGLVFQVLCVLLTLAATRASDSSVATQNNAVFEEFAANKSLTQAEPNANENQKHEEAALVAESSDIKVAKDEQNVDKINQLVGDVVAPVDMAQIQQQIEMLKQPEMRRLARALNRFHEGQLFDANKKRKASVVAKDEDDAIAEERAVRRRIRVRRKKLSNKDKRKQHHKKVANRKKSTRRNLKAKKKSINRKKAKGAKKQSNRRGLSSGSGKKKSAKGAKTTKRNKNDGPKESSGRRASSRGRSNRKNMRTVKIVEDNEAELH